ncbi:MAG: hypothetical protein AAF617_02180 [Bacteroidota bacterium]
MNKGLQITAYLLTILVLTLSCNSDDDSANSNNTTTNKMIFDGMEFPIEKAVSYTELRPSTQDYFFDITFLGTNTDIGINEDFRGNGTIFTFAFINATNTFLSDGEYTISTNSTNTLFDISFCELFITYDFAPSLGSFSYDYSLQDGYNDVTQSVTVLINRSGDTYSITGAGVTDDGKLFSIQFTGMLEVDPDSE